MTQGIQSIQRPDIERDESRLDFLAYASHEIRTPINGIVGMTDFLLDSPLSAEQLEWVEAIRNCSETLLEFINNILDLSKVNAGRMQIEHSKCDINSLIEECMDVVAPILKDKPVVMFNRTARNTPQILQLDPTRMRQIICNLLGNAAKFTENGSIEIYTHTAVNNDRNQLLIEVIDTGCGIPAESIGHLFTPFTQLSPSMRAKTKGTGLGLTISQKIARILGGDITVSSTEGQGSNFTISIPIPEETESRQAFNITDCNIFLISQDRYLAEATTKIVRESIIYSPIVMPENHGEILKFVRSQSGRFVVIIDEKIMNTQPDGVISLIRQIRESCNFERTPVILLKNPGWKKKFNLDGLDISSIRRTPLKQSVLAGYIRELALIPAPDFNFNQEESERRQRISQKFDSSLFSHTRILVADDDLINRKVMEVTLKKFGISADFATNGEEAVEAASNVQYPLILMDCQMPDIDGFEATRMIRQLPGYEQTPILALTANSVGDGLAEARRSGMSGYLVKPVNIQELFATLKLALINVENRSLGVRFG